MQFRTMKRLSNQSLSVYTMKSTGKTTDRINNSMSSSKTASKSKTTTMNKYKLMESTTITSSCNRKKTMI